MFRWKNQERLLQNGIPLLPKFSMISAAKKFLPTIALNNV